MLLTACSGTSVPDKVLEPEKMQAVLYDVIRADEMVDFLKLTDSSWQPFSRRTALYDSIFQIHNVKKESFQTSLRFYQGRPDLLKNILENLHEVVTDTTTTRPKPEIKP